MLEGNFQPDVIARIKEMFPGAYVIKNDPSYIRSFPDLTVLWHQHWAVLETKRGLKAPKRPNQDHYVQELNRMSFSRFVNPTNLEEVMYDMAESFES